MSAFTQWSLQANVTGSLVQSKCAKQNINIIACTQMHLSFSLGQHLLSKSHGKKFAK